MNKLKIAALLAFAGSGIYTQTAQALSYSSGDVLIGFRSTADGVTDDYVIDVGQALFTQAANNGGSVTIGKFGTDLSTVDSNWFTDGLTTWGVAGNNLSSDSNSKTLYAGYAETSPTSTPGTSYNGQTNANSTTQQGRLSSVGSNFGGNATGSPAGDTGGFNYPGLQVTLQTAANSTSWASLVDFNSDGIGFQHFTGFEGTVGAGLPGDSIDLYKITPSPSTPTFEGTFNVASDGTVTFSTGVPEPSTLAALLGGGGLLGMIRRRRAAQA